MKSIPGPMISRPLTKPWMVALGFASAVLQGCARAQPGASVVAGDADLPAEVREQLDRQALAMGLVYIEFTESEFNADLVDSGGPTTYFVYCEGRLFYNRWERLLKGGSKYSTEVAFDGKILYVGDAATPRVLSKFLVTDSTDPDRTKRKCLFPYLDGAGFYVPVRISEVQQFSSPEPLLLHYLRQSKSTRVVHTDGSLRISVRVPDNLLVAVRETNLHDYQKNREALGFAAEVIAREIAWYKRLRNLTPERNITFLLDAKHGYGVAEREEWTIEGQRILRTQSEDWKYYEVAGIWLPSRCATFYYSPPLFYERFSDHPVVTNTTELKLVEFGRKGIPLALDYTEPGAIIEDRTIAEARGRPTHRVMYTVAANGKQLRQAAENVMSHRRFLRICIITVAVLPIILFFRNRRKTRQLF